MNLIVAETNMTNSAEIQHISLDNNLPDDEQFNVWVDAVLKHLHKQGKVVIRLVDEAESQQLNDQYRQKNAATNVLSFPFEAPEFIEDDHLGDLVICVPVVNREANEQGKPGQSHWAHMVVHGMLHLLGYDHINDKDAELMENTEISILKQLGINNPYES